MTAFDLGILCIEHKFNLRFGKENLFRSISIWQTIKVRRSVSHICIDKTWNGIVFGHFFFFCNKVLFSG